MQCVSGYTRRDGTVVPTHKRRAPAKRKARKSRSSGGMSGSGAVLNRIPTGSVKALID